MNALFAVRVSSNRSSVSLVRDRGTASVEAEPAETRPVQSVQPYPPSRITTRGTAYLVLLLASRDALSVDEARSLLDEMIKEGWYCVPDVYAQLVRKLESMTE